MTTQPARGMRDFLPDDVRRRDYVVGVVREVYERYGFEPLETPAVEDIETLLGKYGEEGNRLIFKILRRGEHEASGQADLALRYDLTVPLARVVAEYQAKLPRIFKRYQIQPVWRADRPARGRFREFYQCDVDIVGSTSMVVEAELCAAVSDVLTRLGFDDFAIRLNHRQLLTWLLAKVGIAADGQDGALVAIDKLDKAGHEVVRAELVERGAAGGAADELLAWLTRRGSNEALLDDLGEAGGARELAEILRLLEPTGVARRVRIDPSLARGLSYYTGAIMEVAVPDLAGSLGGGGRYDRLIGMFLGREVPACGFSLGLERILVVMGERAMFPKSVVRAASDVMVTLWSEDSRPDALALAQQLRAAGLRVDVYPELDKLAKQFKFASGRQVPFVAVIGDDERARNEVTIKDMRVGKQTTVERNQVAEYLKDRATRDA